MAIRPGLRLTGLNCLAVEAEGTLVQADPGGLAGPGQVAQAQSLYFAGSGSPVELGQVVQAQSLYFAGSGSPAELGQLLQAQLLYFADRACFAPLVVSMQKEIERSSRCIYRSLRSGPRLREIDAA